MGHNALMGYTIMQWYKLHGILKKNFYKSQKLTNIDDRFPHNDEFFFLYANMYLQVYHAKPPNEREPNIMPKY